MSSDPYSALARALFENPAHAGDLDGAISVAIDDPDVRIELAATTRKDTIHQLRFHAWGCPHVLAAAEYFCAQYEGRPIADLESFAAADFMQSLAVPVEKSGRILVIEDAVRSLGTAIRETSSSTGQD